MTRKKLTGEIVVEIRLPLHRRPFLYAAVICAHLKCGRMANFFLRRSCVIGPCITKVREVKEQ